MIIRDRNNVLIGIEHCLEWGEIMDLRSGVFNKPDDISEDKKEIKRTEEIIEEDRVTETKKSELDEFVELVKTKNKEYEDEIEELKARIKELEKENEELQKFKDKFTYDKTLYQDQIISIELFLGTEDKTIREIAEETNTSIGTIYRVKNKEIHYLDYPTRP